MLYAIRHGVLACYRRGRWPREGVGCGGGQSGLRRQRGARLRKLSALLPLTAPEWAQPSSARGLHDGVLLPISCPTRHRSGTQRFVPDSFKLRTARFEHAHRRLAELSHIDHEIKLCPLFVDLGDRARSGVQKCSKTICTDNHWESSSHQHLQIRQSSGEVAAPCS